MIRRARRAGIVALVAASLVVTACAAPAASSSEVSAPSTPRVPLTSLELVADPRAHVGPSSATITDATVEPVTADPAQSLPTTVVSRDASGDRDVEITDTSRVVTMDIAGSIAATVWGLGLGDTLVGRDISTTFTGVEDLPVVTSSGHTVSAESVIALRPTVVITDGSIGPRDVVEQLRDVGIDVVFVDNDPSFDGAAQLARDVAAVFGATEAGDLLADRIDAEVADVRAQIDEIAPSATEDRVRMLFLYLRGTSGVYYIFGDESGVDNLIAGLGGVDIAAELGWTGMRPLTDEAMVAADPDLILVMTHGLESTGGVEGLTAEMPAIALTKAGQNQRFVDMEDGQILSFGPRSASILDALARAVYAPQAS